MNIKQLHYFIAIAENGTISAAAKKMGISQPPLSAQLKLLEENLNVQLIERGARHITLTDAGKILYKRAISIVSLSDMTIKELSNFKNGMQGTLRMGTISSSGAALFKQRMVIFQAKYPHITFEIHEGNTYQLLELLKSNVIDVAIVRTPFQTDGYDCIYLDEEPMIAVGHKKYFSHATGTTIPIVDLSEIPVIYYRRMEHIITAAFQANGIEPYVYCKNDDARTTLMWAQAGLGVAIVPKSILSVFHDDQLEHRVIDDSSLNTRIAAIRKKKEVCPPIALAFLEIFKESDK